MHVYRDVSHLSAGQKIVYTVNPLINIECVLSLACILFVNYWYSDILCMLFYVDSHFMDHCCSTGNCSDTLLTEDFSGMILSFTHSLT